jgi:nucleotide-binding universal stress UspA family protein
VLVMVLAVRPLLRRLQRQYEHSGRLGPGLVGFILVMVLASAWLTEQIGIHALFGAFMMGAMMPNGSQFVRALSEKLEDFTVALLLPIFFAYTGLQTNFGLISAGGLWGDVLLIVLVASAGKFIGSAAAAVATGMPRRESAALGVLMNARGLIELVILEIGLQEGVLTPPVFAMMVIMAVATTAATSPLLDWVLPRSRVRGAGPAGSTATDEFTILAPVAAPESGPRLARLSAALLGAPAESPVPGRLLAMHLLQPANEQFGSGLEELEHRRFEALDPILAEARRLRLPVEPIAFASVDVPGDIAAVARARGVGLVLMGFHRPLFGTEILGGLVHRVLQSVRCDVAILVERGLGAPRRVLVGLVGTAHDRLALGLAERLHRSSGTEVHVLNVAVTADGKSTARTLATEVFPQIDSGMTVTFEQARDADPVDAILRACPTCDLLILGVDENLGLDSHWFGFRPQRLANESAVSLLIVRSGAAAKPQ